MLEMLEKLSTKEVVECLYLIRKYSEGSRPTLKRFTRILEDERDRRMLIMQEELTLREEGKK